MSPEPHYLYYQEFRMGERTKSEAFPCAGIIKKDYLSVKRGSDKFTVFQKLKRQINDDSI